MKQKQIIIFVGFGVIVLLGIFFFFRSLDKNPKAVISPSPAVLDPATCSLQGTLRYVNADTYRHEDAKLIYQGIDHESRLIAWKITPEDGLRIGPNIFDRLPLPNGETLIFVVLPEHPIAKEYELTASVNYGRLNADGVLHTYEAACSGKTTVLLP